VIDMNDRKLRTLDEMRQAALRDCAGTETLALHYDRQPDFAGNMRAVLAFDGHEKTFEYSLPPMQLETKVFEVLKDYAAETRIVVDSERMLFWLFHFMVATRQAADEMDKRVQDCFRTRGGTSNFRRRCMADPSELRKQAKRVQEQLARHGAVTLYLDDTGEPRVIPGYSPRLVGVYEQGASRDQLVEDIAEALGDG
jgi:hypothetical protein